MSQLSLLDDEGQWQVEVWCPVGAGWVPLSRIYSGRFGPTDRGEAERQAAAWTASGVVIDPRARVAPTLR